MGFVITERGQIGCRFLLSVVGSCVFICLFHYFFAVCVGCRFSFLVVGSLTADAGSLLSDVGSLLSDAGSLLSDVGSLLSVLCVGS